MTELSKEALVRGYRIQTIQEAALRVIDRKGLAGATIQEVADEAGVAKGTIYLYFESREDLVWRTAELALSQLREKVDATFALAQPLPERLRALVRAKLEFFEAHREFFRIYVALAQGEVERICTHRRRSPVHRIYLDRLSAFLAEEIERGTVKAVDPARLATFFAEGISAVILRRLSEDRPPPPEADVEWIVSMLLGGIATGRSAS